MHVYTGNGVIHRTGLCPHLQGTQTAVVPLALRRRLVVLHRSKATIVTLAPSETGYDVQHELPYAQWWQCQVWCVRDGLWAPHALQVSFATQSRRMPRSGQETHDAAESPCHH